jgi:hypothetical protein
MNLNDKLENLITLIDSQPCGVFIEISRLSNDEKQFIEAIKFLIDLRGKPYEFNSNYTKVRRISNEF